MAGRPFAGGGEFSTGRRRGVQRPHHHAAGISRSARFLYIIHWFCGRGGSSPPYIQHANLFGSQKVSVTCSIFAVDNSTTQICQIDPLTELKHGITQPNGCIVRAEVHVVKERAARSEARNASKVLAAVSRLLYRLNLEQRLDQLVFDQECNPMACFASPTARSFHTVEHSIADLLALMLK